MIELNQRQMHEVSGGDGAANVGAGLVGMGGAMLGAVEGGVASMGVVAALGTTAGLLAGGALILGVATLLVGAYQMSK